MEDQHLLERFALAMKSPDSGALSINATQLKPVCWSDIIKFWMVLEGVYSINLLCKKRQEHMFVFDLLMRMTEVWSDNAQQLRAVVEQLQILAIIMVLTAKVSHEGKHVVNEANTKDECWYEPADVTPVPMIQVACLFFLQLFASQAILFYRPPVQAPVPMMFKLLPSTENTKSKDEFLIDLERALEELQELMKHAQEGVPQTHARFRAVTTLLYDVVSVVI